MKTLNERLAVAMKARGDLKPAELARRAGISKGGVGYITKGTTKADTIRATTIDALAAVLKVNRDWLLYGTGPMEGLSPGPGVALSYVKRLDPGIVGPATMMAQATLGKEVVFDPAGDVPLFIAAYELMADATVENRARFDAALAERKSATAGGTTIERSAAKAPDRGTHRSK